MSSRSNQSVRAVVIAYTRVVPRLWTDTIEAHRRAVRDAALETTAALVAEHGLASLTMSQIAERTGIGRATLYKYFPDVEAILVAWHERHEQHVARHLENLVEVRDHAGGDPRRRLEAVLEAHALITHGVTHAHLGAELTTLLPRDGHVAGARQHLHDFVRDLLAEAATAGQVRGDVAPDELAAYCLHALMAAPGLPSEAAVRRLVVITLAGLHGADA